MQKLGDLNSIVNVLSSLEPQYIIILPHVRTDPDALGCSAGLANLLMQLSHKVEIIVDEEPDQKLKYIYEDSPLNVFSKEFLKKMEKPDLIIYLDHHSEKRLNQRIEIPHLYPQTQIMIIDHHLIEAEEKEKFYNQKEFKNRKIDVWIDKNRSSVSEMIGEIFLSMNLHGEKQIIFDRATSISLLAGIYGDTGGLRYSNTTSRSYFVCSKLMRDDISIDKISDPIFANKNLNQIRMISKIFENAELNSQGNLIWYGVTQEFLDENNGNQDDLEGVCSQLREIENIDLAILFREIDANDIRINLRSNENFDCAELARFFGGGGHIRASGMTIKNQGTLKEVMQLVIHKASELMANKQSH